MTGQNTFDDARSFFRGARAEVITLVIILFLQVGFMVRMGVEKKEYHLDEVYSYVLANSHRADRITNRPDLWERWISPGELNEVVTVQEGERFSFGTVYRNNVLDIHPPLYYWALHSVCSLFANRFSKWFGLSLNILLFLLNQLVLYALSKRLLRKPRLALLPPLLYGGSMVALDTVLFLRMYMMLTFWTTLLVWLALDILERGQTAKKLVMLYVVTLGGLMTQYLFAIVAFFITVSVCLTKFWRRQIKEPLIFGATMLGAVGSLLLIYPAALMHLRGSETNPIGAEIMNHIRLINELGETVRLNLKDLYDTVRIRSVTLPVLMGFGVICLLFVISSWIDQKKASSARGNQESLKPELNEVKRDQQRFVRLFTTFALTFVVVSHVTAHYRSLRYLYSLMPILSLLVIMLFVLLIQKISLDRKIFELTLIFAVLFSVISFMRNPISQYMYQDVYDKDRCRICDYETDLCLFVNANLPDGSGYATAPPTENLLRMMAYDHIYMTDEKGLYNWNGLYSDQDFSDGVIVFVATDQNWLAGLNGDSVMEQILNNSAELREYVRIQKTGLCDIYYAH
ncbi:MAG: hypothetical protein ACOX2M_03085 [Fastidiosipilaceae bacterium]|jgi:hypothetical protein